MPYESFKKRAPSNASATGSGISEEMRFETLVPEDFEEPAEQEFSDAENAPAFNLSASAKLLLAYLTPSVQTCEKLQDQVDAITLVVTPWLPVMARISPIVIGIIGLLTTSGPFSVLFLGMLAFGLFYNAKKLSSYKFRCNFNIFQSRIPEVRNESQNGPYKGPGRRVTPEDFLATRGTSPLPPA